jgi:hypothetical protein
MHAQSRQAGMLKSEKRDALGLANHLYNQLELGVQVSTKLQVVRRALPHQPPPHNSRDSWAIAMNW